MGGIIVAIDPGKSGGIAYAGYLGTGNSEQNAISMPATDREVYETLLSCKSKGDTVAYLEGTVKYAGTNMPGSAGIVYGDSCGFVRGVLTALQYRIVVVPPKAWQKALGLGSRDKGMSKTVWKNKLKQKAGQLFPNIKVTLKNADALLILEAARRGLLG